MKSAPPVGPAAGGAEADRPATPAVAGERHSCPACGAAAEWNPGKQRLICPFCGTEAPFEVDASGEVRELDLATALRELPDDKRGWAEERKSVQCRSCRAVMVFPPERVGQNCEFCGSPALVPYEETKAPIRPRSLLPFRITANQVREQLRVWLGKRWFAPSDLRKRASVDRIHGIYVPYWTFDAETHCRWTADAGYYYYVTETYREGNQTKTRQVRKVRWEPASGAIDHTFDDELIPGTKGLDRGLLAEIEPFPTKELVPYETEYVSGFPVEHYQIVLVDAAQASRESMTEKLRAMCSREVPGDTQRNLEVYPTFAGETFKHCLLPVFVLAYKYGSKPFQVIANGVTGKLAGKAPLSYTKIFFAVVGALVVAAVIFAMTRS